MLAYSAKRFCLSLAIVTLAIALLFCMIYVIPGDPVKIALGPRATPEIVESFRIKMGLDKPLWEQFARFYWLAAQGDLGTDILTGRGVGLAVMEQMPFTLTLIAFSIGWSVLLGMPLGCLAAIKRGSIADRIAGFLSVAMIAVPSFVVAIYALLIFAVSLGWFPAIGAGDRGDFWDQFSHLVLPSFAIGIGWVGYLARLVRASMLEIMGENHVRTARAFGLPERRIVFRYALKLAILPTITILGIGVGHMLSGAVFTEIVFARPGVGKLVYDAINTRNFPMITGAVLVTTAFYVFTMMLSDLIVASLDPRVRTSLR